MGPPPPSPQPPQGLCFGASSWAWGIGQQGQSSPNPQWTDAMGGGEGGDGGGAGLRFLLQFDPGRPGLDRTLLGFSLSAVLSRLLGRSKDGGGRGRGFLAIAGEEGGDGGGGSGNAAVSGAALAAAVSLCFAAIYASDHRSQRALPPPPPRNRRRRRLLPAPDSAARPCALLSPDDGLRILSSNDDSSQNVIHGASVGAGDDEPDIVARVEMDTTPGEIAGVVTNAADETEHCQAQTEEEERRELERQEQERLRELWLSLLEREQRLELRLQELEGLREQQAAVRELEGRAAAAAAEERLLQLRVSTLQEENGRLRAQAEELGAARAELARAKEKLRAVKARVQEEQEEVRREAAALREKLAELERGGEERAGALAAEIAELRKANAALEEENLELALKLQDAGQAASPSVNPVLEEDMAEEVRYLRETNETLTRQIEQLHSDHCAHVEELVYLKWVNACLRHELRDGDGGHHPAAERQDHHAAVDAGDLCALELSKSMSFRSSERARQLMLRYGHPGLEAFDPALFSPLHESSVAGDERSPARSYYEPDRSPYAGSEKMTTASAAAAAGAPAPGKKAGGPRKLKLLGNIKKLLPGGKKGHSSHHGHHGHGHAGGDSRKAAAAAAAAPSDEYLEKAMRWLSTHDVLGGDHSYESTPLSSCARTPMSSVTTATTRGGEHSERGETAAAAGPAMARSKSDAGRSYGREASRYHALRPDHPAAGGGGGAIEPEGFRAPEKREQRRRSEELRSPAVA
ncbi:unnamed protein product [Urochloa decumbens]|uniref:Protein CHUP1, chloroplastic n=1 Tax=Urochloa decumbens TaxID=240449 RepID=A0ABC8YSJ1_9POAL